MKTSEQLARENRRLQDDLDAIRYEQEQEREHREREQDRRRQEQRREREEQMRAAYSWPEAFRKNRYLMEKERNECFAPADEDPDYIKMMTNLRDNWDRSLAEVDRAAAIWADEQRTIDEAIRQMRTRVADRLRAENPNSELADYIANDDIDGWMNW